MGTVAVFDEFPVEIVSLKAKALKVLKTPEVLEVLEVLEVPRTSV